LEFVQSTIVSAPPGKYVNLAMFDQVFEGRPPVLPLVILSWKDWQGEPVQSFPRRGKIPAGPTQNSSHMAPAAAQAMAAAAPAFPPRPSQAIPIPLSTKQPVPDVPAFAPPMDIAAPPPAARQQPSAPPPGIAALAAAFAPAQHPPSQHPPAQHPPSQHPPSQHPPSQSQQAHPP